MRRHASRGVELARKGSDAEADIPIEVGASVGRSGSQAIPRLAASEAQAGEACGMSDETEIDPGYACNPDESAGMQVLAEDLRGAYAVLDELIEQLAEACEEQTEWREEIDRQNLQRLLDDIAQVQRVIYLVQEIVDPLGAPSTDDPIKE
jgi:hypothetical protein